MGRHLLLLRMIMSVSTEGAGGNPDPPARTVTRTQESSAA